MTAAIQERGGREWVEISEHAGRRWAQRAKPCGVGPRAAWLHGVRLSDELHGDEVRFHPPSETILIRRENTLVTVYALETAAAPIREAVLARFGGESA